MLLTGQRDLRTKYVMVDEVQDYTPAQLMVLRKYYPRARFMLLGDEYQAIREGTVSFAQIHKLFEKAPSDSTGRQINRIAKTDNPGRVTELFLTTSYRSSPEITALFAGLLPEEQQILVSSVQPSGFEPVFKACKNRDEYAQNLVLAVKSAQEQDGLTAIVCAGARSMEKTAALLAEQLTDLTDHEKQGPTVSDENKTAAGLPDSCPVPVIRSGDSLPGKGVFLITLAHAKGLEFDGVILPDANRDNYPDTVLARHRLYTALSRATRRLTVLARGEMTPLLAH